MMTSSVGLYGDRPGGVCVANGHPRWMPGMPRYAPVMPEWDAVRAWKRGRITWESFEHDYLVKLSRLDPEVVVKELEQLGRGAEPVLLCWEDLREAGQCCHRRILAEWIERETGLVVPEWEVPVEESRQLGLF